MNKTKVQAQGTAVTVDGMLKYRLEWFCLEAGELPDTKIFLYKFVDVTDPTSDEFVRVVYPGDFDNYPTERLEATNNSEYYYRSAYLFRLYDDVRVASAAQRALEDYINSLVTDYLTYKNNIKKPPHNIEFPSSSPDYITELKNAYLVLYSALLTANADYATTQTAYTQAKNKYSAAANNYSTWNALHLQAQTQQTTLGSFVSLVDSNVGKLADKPGYTGTLDLIISALPGAKTASTGLVYVVNSIATQAAAARVESETAAQEVSSTRQSVYEKYATALTKWNAADAKLTEIANYDATWAAEQRVLLDANKPVEPTFD